MRRTRWQWIVNRKVGIHRHKGSLSPRPHLELSSQGSATLTMGGNNRSATFSGRITGTGGLIKVGTGTLTLAATRSLSTSGQRFLRRASDAAGLNLWVNALQTGQRDEDVIAGIVGSNAYFSRLQFRF